MGGLDDGGLGAAAATAARRGTTRTGEVSDRVRVGKSVELVWSENSEREWQRVWGVDVGGLGEEQIVEEAERMDVEKGNEWEG